MTVHVSCRCGKQGRVPDELASEQLTCPGCGRLLPDDLVRTAFDLGFTVRILKARAEAANRITSTNNLHQIALAMHINADIYDGILPLDGPPDGLSWRVLLLPFLDRKEATRLYRHFHFDEPWNSPENLRLLPFMPDVYLNPRFQTTEDRVKGLTYYRGFVGEKTVLGGPAPVSLGQLMSAAGSANTLVVVEAGEPTPWTKPEDATLFNEKSPFGGPQGLDYQALYADGHVTPIPAATDRKLIGALIDWQRSEAVTPP